MNLIGVMFVDCFRRLDEENRLFARLLSPPDISPFKNLGLVMGLAIGFADQWDGLVGEDGSAYWRKEVVKMAKTRGITLRDTKGLIEEKEGDGGESDDGNSTDEGNKDKFDFLTQVSHLDTTLLHSTSDLLVKRPELTSMGAPGSRVQKDAWEARGILLCPKKVMAWVGHLDSFISLPCLGDRSGFLFGYLNLPLRMEYYPGSSLFFFPDPTTFYSYWLLGVLPLPICYYNTCTLVMPQSPKFSSPTRTQVLPLYKRLTCRMISFLDVALFSLPV